MRPPKKMANRSQRTLDMKRLWKALDEEPPGPIQSIAPASGAPPQNGHREHTPDRHGA